MRGLLLLLVPAARAWLRPATRRRSFKLQQWSDDDLLSDAGFADDWSEYDAAPPRANHGYEREYNDHAPVDVAAIDAALLERNEAKRARDFATADAIRDGLLRDYNVVVWDRDRMWRVRHGGPPKKRALPTEHDFVRDPRDTADVDVAAVDALLLERLHYKLLRDFDGADAAKERLQREYNVQVWEKRRDGTKTWRVGGNPNDYKRAATCEGVIEDEAAVTDLIKQRQNARRTQNYARADELLLDLLRLGVWVDDKKRTYRAVDGYSAPSDPPPGLDVEEVAELVRRRSAAKLLRRWSEADDIRSQLLLDYGVHVDDKKMYWYWKPAPGVVPEDDDA